MWEKRQMSIQKGNIIETHAKYEVLERLGEGNYGIVFLARHQEVKREVAIKVLSGAKAAFSELQQEMWVQGRLSHPNIVSVIDFTAADEKGQLILEYVENSLQKILAECASRRKPVTVQFALQVIKGCMEGLAYAHDNGIVHGDIKPGNILIDNNDNPKLSDFGLARLMGTGAKYKEGSARWAAPEVLKRWRKDKVWACDYQSDLFSLGVVAYLLLSGRHPFLDPSGALSIEEVILNDDIVPSFPYREGETIPYKYVAMTMKLIQREKKQRYSSARDALDDLQERPMIACSKCGEKNPEDASFCNWCGRNIKAEQLANMPTDQRMLYEAHDLFVAKQNEKGLSKIEELLKKGKNDAEAWCDIGYKFNNMHWYHDADIAATRAIEMNEKLLPAYQTRGFARSCLGDSEKAVTDFTKALDLARPEDTYKRSQILYQRGYAFMRMNRLDDACKDATESFQLNSELDKAAWLMSKTCT
jgi:serine/threonine protein kinase